MSVKMFNVGKLVNTHGIKGEVKIFPVTDFPELRFKKNSKLILVSPEGNNRIDVEVVSSREHKNMFIVKLQGFHNINEVEQYKGWSVMVDETKLEKLPPNEFYYHEIIGCQVITDEGKSLGVITEILKPGANDVWVVQPPQGKPVLLPYIDEVILEVDISNKLVKAHLLEGLI